MVSQLHFAEYALALHLLLEGAERLIDVVVANKNLYQGRSPSSVADRDAAKMRTPPPAQAAAGRQPGNLPDRTAKGKRWPAVVESLAFRPAPT